MKKILALVLAALMLVAMAVPAFAVDDDPASAAPSAAPDYDHPLTVTGLTKGDTVAFYQVIQWVGETSDKSDVSGWKAVAPFDTYLTKAKLTEILVGIKDDPETEDVNEAKAATGITSDVAGELAKLASGAGTAGTLNDAGTVATLDNAQSGMWMALVTPTDANTIYNPVFVSADYKKTEGGTVAMTAAYEDAVAKKSTLTLTKTASTTEDTWDDSKPQTTAVGDTVSFTVNTQIPGYGEVYEHPHFVMTDSLTALSLNTNSVTVTAPTGLKKKGAEGVEDADADYEVSASTTGYTITFTEKYLKTVKTATTLTVTYSAVVTVAATHAIDEENNEVQIEYSHNPNDQSDYDVKKDTTQHYTFSIDASGIAEGDSTKIKGKKTSEIVKIGLDAAGNPITETKTTSEIGDPETDYVTGPLEGAVFGLFTDAAGNTPLKDKDNKDVTATTGADGRMNFAGLDAGTYYLKEISAPAGYVTNSTVHKVEIIAEVETVKVTEYYKNGEWSATNSEGAKAATYETEILKSYTVKIDNKTAAQYTFTNEKVNNHSTEIQWDNAELVEHPVALENTKGVELPSTGGMGTTILYVAGSILVLAAGILLVTKRRMNAED